MGKHGTNYDDMHIPDEGDESVSSASLLTCELLNCFSPEMREEMYQKAERDHGKGFAAHLRDRVEAHHLIVANELTLGDR